MAEYVRGLARKSGFSCCMEPETVQAPSATTILIDNRESEHSIPKSELKYVVIGDMDSQAQRLIRTYIDGDSSPIPTDDLNHAPSYHEVRVQCQFQDVSMQIW